MKHVALSEVKDDLSKYLRLAEKEEADDSDENAGEESDVTVTDDSDDE